MDDDETIPAPLPPRFWTAKRIILAESLCFVAVVAGLSVGFVRYPAISGALSILNMFGCGVWMLAWIKADSLDRGYALYSRFPLLVVVFGTFALVYYLFRSRGFVRGLVGVVYFLLFSFFALITVMIAGSMVLIMLVLITGPAGLESQ